MILASDFAGTFLRAFSRWPSHGNHFDLRAFRPFPQPQRRFSGEKDAEEFSETSLGQFKLVPFVLRFAAGGQLWLARVGVAVMFGSFRCFLRVFVCALSVCCLVLWSSSSSTRREWLSPTSNLWLQWVFAGVRGSILVLLLHSPPPRPCPPSPSPPPPPNHQHISPSLFLHRMLFYSLLSVRFVCLARFCHSQWSSTVLLAVIDLVHADYNKAKHA